MIAEEKHDPRADRAEPVRMNVMIVSGYWTTQPLEGGVRRHVITLVQALKGKHDVSVFVPDWRQKRLVHESIDGVAVFRRRLAVAPASRHRFLRQFVSWLLNLPGTLLALRRAVAEQGIDVVHLHQVTAGSQFNFWLLRKLGGPPFIVGFHGRETRDFTRSPWLTRLQMGRLIHGAAAGVAVSRELLELGTRNGWRIDRSTAIPSGTDLDKVLASAEQIEPVGQVIDGPYFVMLGRLHEVKGQDLAIAAWKYVCADLPNVHLVLVGDFATEGGYEELVAESGLAHRIHLLGRQTHDAALGWLKGATGLIQASRSEGGCAPFAILEAAVLGIPVIVTGIPSLRETIRDGQTGLIVEPENPGAIADAVKRLASDARLASRLGESLSRYARSELTADNMADRYAQVYREVATGSLED